MKRRITIVMAIFMLLAVAVSASSIDYFSWRSAAIDSSTGVTCTVITGQKQFCESLDIINRGAVEVYIDVGGDATTVNVGAAYARLGPNHTYSLDSLPPSIKTIGFKTASGTGTVDVHSMIITQSEGG